MADYRLLTMQQVAKSLQVSLKTVYRWIDSGQLPVCKIGERTYRIFEKDLVEFVYSRRGRKQVKSAKRAGR